MLKPRVNLLGAFARGLVAGAAGAGAQALFFRVAKGSAHQTSNNGASASSVTTEDAPREKPEPEKKPGSAVRHFIGRWLKEEPMFGEKAARGRIVHYASGALWGGVYGLARESRSPLLRGPLGAAGFCASASMLSEHMILPLFPSGQRPGGGHRYAWAGDMVYGTVVPTLYEAMRPQRWAEASSAAWVRRLQRELSRRLPAELHPAIGPVLEAIAALRKTASAMRDRVR